MIASSRVTFARRAIAILVLALVLRSAWGSLIPVVPVSDSFAYDTMARMLVEKGVYGWTADQPSAFWPVGTSAIYAAVYALFGLGYGPIVVLNILLGVAIVALTMLLARLLFDDTVALLAGLLMALWPGEVAYVTILASELPFIFFVLIGFAAWFGAPRASSPSGVLCGLSFAAATYIRPVAALLPALLWISALPNWHKLRETLPIAVLTTVMLAVAVVPWSIRNTQVFGHFVLLSTNGGAVLWMGNNPQTSGFYMKMPASTDGLDEYQRDRVLGAEAVRYIVEQPTAFLLRTMKKAVLLHLGETIAVHWNAEGIKQRFGEAALLPLKLITQGYWMGMLAMGIAGLLVLFAQLGLLATLLHPIVLTWAYFTALYAATVVQDRYHFPCHPLIAILAAIAMLAAVKRSSQTSRGVLA